MSLRHLSRITSAVLKSEHVNHHGFDFQRLETKSRCLKHLYLQALWDKISEDPGALPVPESHLRLAEERLKRYRENPSRAHSGFEVLDRLADKSKSK